MPATSLFCSSARNNIHTSLAATFCQAAEQRYENRHFEGGEAVTWDHEGDGAKVVTGEGYPCSDRRSTKGMRLCRSAALSLYEGLP
jgi:hypothetical protein